MSWQAHLRADPLPCLLGADPDHPQIARACDYVLRWCPTTAGGFGCSGGQAERPPPPSAVIHCLNGNLLRA